MSSKVASFLQRNAKPITTGTAVIGAIAAVVTIFVSNSSTSSVEIGDVSQSNGVVAVGENANVGDISTNVFGKTAAEQNAEKLRSARASCESAHRRLTALPISQYPMKSMTYMVGVMIDRVAYEQTYGLDAMDDLEKYYDSQVSVVLRAVTRRGAMQSTDLKAMAMQQVGSSLQGLGVSEEQMAQYLDRMDSPDTPSQAVDRSDADSMEREVKQRMREIGLENSKKLTDFNMDAEFLSAYREEFQKNPNMSSEEMSELSKRLVMQAMLDSTDKEYGYADVSQTELAARRAEEKWRKKNPLVRDFHQYQNAYGPDYEYDFRTDHPADDPATEIDEIGEFYKTQFLATYRKYCDRI
ncbi:MAG: hypothetical protein AAGL69_02855 [Pseudomonadota bacterium]